MDRYTYDEWAELLTGFFFDEAHEGEEILFAVDELALVDASGLQESEACASLAAAVSSVVGRRWDVLAVRRRLERWRSAGAVGAHPAIPFLALTVLAAYRMGAFEGFAPHKFYVPLRRTLDGDDEGTDAPGTYLEYVRELWNDLYLDRRFEEATNDQDVYPFDVEQLPLPAARYAKCASVDVARRVAEPQSTDPVLGALVTAASGRRLVTGPRWCGSVRVEADVRGYGGCRRSGWFCGAPAAGAVSARRGG